MTPARAILAGDRAPETVDALVVGIKRWLASDGEIPLHRYLGFDTPRRERTASRNEGINAALALVPGKNRHPRCQILAERIRTFEARKWHRWQHLAAPPADASELDCLLWHCRRICGALPESVEQLLRITDTFSQSNASGPGSSIRPLEEQTCT